MNTAVVNMTPKPKKYRLPWYLGIIVVVVALMAAVPFYLLILLALKHPEGGLKSITLIPDMHFINLVEAWGKSDLGRAMMNNIIMTVGGVVLLITFASMAGYSIARVKSRLNKIIFGILLVCMMIPGIINTVPLYMLLIRLRGINTYWSMICVMATNSMPFSVFLYTSFITAIPTSLEESAVIDGCSYFQAFWKITFPLMGPVTASVVILQGLGMWNNYAQAVFFLQDKAHRNIPLAVSLFFQQYGADWPLMAAAALIGLVPAVTMFLLFQRYFVEGITTGAIKG